MSNGYGEYDNVKNFEYCEGESTGTDLTVVATGYNLKYQWFKDGTAIPGADQSTYIIASVDTRHTGRYHVVVSGECGSKKSCFYDVLIKPEVISQRWNDVLVVNTDTKTNGGYEFTKIQWYKNGIALSGENLTYMREAGGLDINADYHIVAETQFGTFVSCEFRPALVVNNNIFVFPNPVDAGGIATIRGAELAQSIRLYSLTGQFLLSVTPSVDAKIQMPNLPGIYLVQIVMNSTSSTTFKMVVK
jgi:hypothetical protein